MKRIFQTIIMLLLLVMPLSAQTGVKSLDTDTVQQQASAPTADSVCVSLLTCTAGTEVYEYYGHFALRLRYTLPHRTDDWVFNYGIFSFSQPHFIWRFLLGHTDYQLGVVPYSLFYDSYARHGRGIIEQKLNLTPEECRRLVAALDENVRPENATYRYNFFYDNCTTRPIRMVENAIDGEVVWPDVDGSRTLRDIVHQYAAVSPWNKFGQDLLLGCEADRPADIHKQMFAPLYAEQFIGKASIRDREGHLRPLAQPSVTLLPAQPVVEGNGTPVTPAWFFGTLLALTLAISAMELVKKTYCWAFDVVLLIAQGLTGCIIAFLFFFSTHPTVGTNWLVALFNPLPLVLFPWFMKAAAAHRFSWTMGVQAVMVVVTLAAGAFGLQSFPVEVYLIAVTLLVRVCEHARQTLPALTSRRIH